MAKITLITGTDTGVGKTVLVALLLRHLRQEGERALAMKPFCSGGRHDAELLWSLQKEYLTLDETNPFHFRQPLAPWVAARNERRQIEFSELANEIRARSRQCEMLLIEGAGGILAPFGPGYSATDVVEELGCRVVVVARNQLGMINHTLLTAGFLQGIGVKQLAIVLMGVKKPDLSSETNAQILSELLPETPLFPLPFLGPGADSPRGVKKNEKKLKKLLRGLSRVLL